MHPFRFRLEALLKFRKMQKEEAQIAYTQAVTQLRKEREVLTTLQGQLMNNVNFFRDSQKDMVTVEQFKQFQHFFDKIKKDIMKQQDSVRQAENYCQQCLQGLEEAAKQCKIVEKFREKQLEQYRLEMLKEEQKQLDEIGLQIYARG